MTKLPREQVLERLGKYGKEDLPLERRVRVFIKNKVEATIYVKEGFILDQDLTRKNNGSEVPGFKMRVERRGSLVDGEVKLYTNTSSTQVYAYSGICYIE